GVNLLEVLTRARRLGLRVAPELIPKQIAKTVVAALEATPAEKRDKNWYLPTLAEASLGLDDWDAVETNVRAYAASENVKPFQIESTLRQSPRYGMLRRLTNEAAASWQLCGPGSCSFQAGK